MRFLSSPFQLTLPSLAFPMAILADVGSSGYPLQPSHTHQKPETSQETPLLPCMFASAMMVQKDASLCGDLFEWYGWHSDLKRALLSRRRYRMPMCIDGLCAVMVSYETRILTRDAIALHIIFFFVLIFSPIMMNITA